MLYYDFDSLIKKPSQQLTDYFQQKVASRMQQHSTDIIDHLWDCIKSVSKEVFEADMTDVLDSLKTDVLISLYATLFYTTDSGIQKNAVISKLKEYDPALRNEDSETSKAQALSHRKNQLFSD